MPASTGPELQAIDSTYVAAVATELQREKRSEHLIYQDLQQALVELNTESLSCQPSLVSQLKPWSTDVERNVAAEAFHPSKGRRLSAQNPQSPPRAQKPESSSRKIYQVYIVFDSKCWSNATCT